MADVVKARAAGAHLRAQLGRGLVCGGAGLGGGSKGVPTRGEGELIA